MTTEDTTTTDERSELNAADPSPAALTGAPPRRKPGVAVRVDLDGYPEPIEVRVTNVDRIAYEMTLAKHPEWPDPQRSQSFVMTFVTFTAAKRAGHPAATTFDAWRAIVLDWDELEEETPADPTR